MKENKNKLVELISSNKKAWVAPVLESCNLNQTMSSTNSGPDGSGSTPT